MDVQVLALAQLCTQSLKDTWKFKPQVTMLYYVIESNNLGVIYRWHWGGAICHTLSSYVYLFLAY